MKLLLLGATGVVGRKILEFALANEALSQIIAPTRLALERSDRLVNPVAPRLESLVSVAMSYKPDIVICALGTTQAIAGSRPGFRYVDYELPIAFGEAAYAAGVQTYAIVTAMGASAQSRSFYYRTKGEVERDLQKIGFRSLTISRPSLIGGDRIEPRPIEEIALMAARILAPILPKRFHVNPAEMIAASLLDAAITGKTGCHWIQAEDMH